MRSSVVSKPRRRISSAVLWVVDDSRTERSLIQTSLGDEYNYVEFTDGAEVIERLGTTTARPNLILLDWVMPGMGGDDVCRFVRSHPELSELPIIVVTSSRIETSDVVEGLELGANDYIAKPFAVEELRARVESVLRSTEMREASRRERARLAAVNQLGVALFEVGTDVTQILRELIASLASQLADGAAITLLPGELPVIAEARHRAATDSDTALLADIATIADPQVFSFESSDHARSILPPKYHGYIERFGLRGLAILPFPIRAPVAGVVTLTRDGHAKPFDAEDLATIETCIEYASLAVQNALRYDHERAARAQLHAILEHAPIGIVVTDGAGTIQLRNPAALRLIPGIERVNALAAVYDLGKWATPDGVPIDRASWRFGADNMELAGAFDDQTTRMLSVSADTLPLRAGGGSVVAIEDISVRHAAIRERERIAAFQERMLGIVGHDLRNPLAAVVVGAEMLVDSVSGDAARTVLRRIQTSCDRMTAIVNLLLDATRARLGTGIPLARTEIALAPLVHGIIDELAASHAVKFEVEGADVRGTWDPDRLAQVISNLASNAVQYGNPDHAIRLGVTTTDTHATISVVNVPRGKPIPPDQLATLFDPFQRGDDARGKNREGLGLGLFIASEIVRAHGGRLDARSSEQSTVFTVELPLRPRSATPSP
ncbi:MAG TPA: ATP-binding protein [Kofleriaceae bacterium]|jgi:signal transduction histidine kinase/DNA-binding response OmpR family regulator